MNPSSSLGFIWFASGASEEHDEFEFAVKSESARCFSDIRAGADSLLFASLSVSDLSVRLADLHSNNTERGRVNLLYGATVSPSFLQLKRTDSPFSACCDLPLALVDLCLRSFPVPLKCAAFDGNSIRANLERFELSTKASLAPFSAYSRLPRLPFIHTRSTLSPLETDSTPPSVFFTTSRPNSTRTSIVSPRRVRLRSRLCSDRSPCPSQFPTPFSSARKFSRTLSTGRLGTEPSS